MIACSYYVCIHVYVPIWSFKYNIDTRDYLDHEQQFSDCMWSGTFDLSNS